MSETRTIERWVGNGCEVVKMSELREGDVFVIVEPDDESEYGPYVATSNPVMGMTPLNVGDGWSITAKLMKGFNSSVYSPTYLSS